MTSRQVAIAVVVGACSSNAAPPTERAEPVEVVGAPSDAARPLAPAPADAAVEERDPLADLPPSGEEPLPEDATQAQIEARYALAVQHATSEPPKALALLLDVAEAEAASVLHAARWDDAWKAHWDSRTFQVIVTMVEMEEAVGDEEDVGAAPKIVCPKGTKKKGSWDEYEGELWCEKPGRVKHGPYHYRDEGYDLSEGVAETGGTYVDGKKHGLWYWSESFSGSSYGAYVMDVEHGLWEVADHDGDSLVVYDRGKRHGTVRTFDGGDRVIGEITYDQDVAHGPFFESEPEDPHDRIREGAYHRGEPHGEWRHYFEAVLRVIEHWDEGVAHGEFAYFDETGALVAKTTMDHGTGDWIAYSRFGTLDERGRLVAGVKDGAWGEHSSARSTWEEGTYTKGKRTGTWKVRSEPGGTVRAEGPYQDGVRTGEWTYWHDSGKPLSKGKFVAGKQHGKWEVLAEDGSVAQTVQLDKGKLVKLDGRAPKKDEKAAFYADAFAEAPYVIERYDEGGHLGEDGW